jgi:endonuclease/exonuclease/phosphatase family metal-dependent hydrolase
MRARKVLAGTCLVLSAFLFPMHERVAALGSPDIVISEFRFRGPNGINDEFIELFNSSPAPVNVGGWMIRASNNNASPTVTTRATIPAGVVINPGCFYLVVNTDGYSGGVPRNLAYSVGIGDDFGVALTRADLTIADQVGHGANGAFGEGTRLPTLATNANRGIERGPGGPAGHVDTDNNRADFHEISPGTPRNAAAASCLTPADPNISASVAPEIVEQGEPVTVFAAVTPGMAPPSSGLAVVGDLSAVGGSAATAFADDGVAPDVTASDNIFTAAVGVSPSAPVGIHPLTLTVSDAQGRSTSAVVSLTVSEPAIVYLPHDIQGPGATSPFAPGMLVIVRGVVTARTSNGFFVQTEPGFEDADDHSSEGHFVFVSGGGPAAAEVGRLMLVRGSVAELVPAADPGSAPITGLNLVTSVIDLGPSALPAPFVLTSTELSDTGAPDQLERFEGMRVTAPSLTSVSGTDGEGAFYAVLTGQARPFREAGIETGHAVPACAVPPCAIPIFDGNPERLRVDSDALDGTAAVHVSTGAVMTDVTGVLDFGARTYTLLPEATQAPAGGLAVTAAPAAAAGQFTIASMNMDAGQAQLSNASLLVRTVLNAPDVIGLRNADAIDVLQNLASQIDADAIAAGGTAPGYAAYPAFLVKTGRVTVLSVEQVGDTETFERPPMVLRALIQGPATSLPQTVTVIANHFDSEADRRPAQAEFLAGYIQGRQLNDPGEAIVSLGGYQAPGFNDGYDDSVGTVRGTPAPGDQAATASPAMVSPELANLTDSVPASERYTSVSGGNAQALDHVLVTANLAAQSAGLVHPRVSGDVPEAQRLSDRDPAVAYFAFPPDVDEPVFSFTPQDQEAEATSAAGAAVNYTSPTATDNLDGDVAVSCEPASGSTFPLGNTTATCTATDAAGNVAAASFTVTVQDTTAPDLAMPADISKQAGSPAGLVVSFSATATDAVTAAPAVTCAPASGSTFPIGVTMVNCTATDAAGNSAHDTFAVTITAVVPGRMHGAGTTGPRLSFGLAVQESANYAERGWLLLKAGPDVFAGVVVDVLFADDPAFAPGSRPASGVDSVRFTGAGWWNGRAGYTFEATASDRGEPGRGHDTFTVVVRAPDGTVVASGGGTLTSGNNQSLR